MGVVSGQSQGKGKSGLLSVVCYQLSVVCGLFSVVCFLFSVISVQYYELRITFLFDKDPFFIAVEFEGAKVFTGAFLGCN